METSSSSENDESMNADTSGIEVDVKLPQEPVPVVSQSQDGEKWRTGNKDHDELYLYVGSFFYDCTFEICKTPEHDPTAAKRFKCHILVLARASPVFETMLFEQYQKNSKSRDDPIVVNGVCPEVFDMAMRFIYGGKKDSWSMENVCKLYKFAENFQIEHLMTSTMDHLKDEVDYEGAFIALDTLGTSCREELKEVFLEKIQSCADLVLISNHWLQASEQTVLEILKFDKLDICSERQLFDALVDWGKAQKGEEGDAAIRARIDKALKLIRFQTMDSTEFLKCVESNILTCEEKLGILISGVSSEMRSGFSIWPISGCRKNHCYSSKRVAFLANNRKVSLLQQDINNLTTKNFVSIVVLLLINNANPLCGHDRCAQKPDETPLILMSIDHCNSNYYPENFMRSREIRFLPFCRKMHLGFSQADQNEPAVLNPKKNSPTMTFSVQSPGFLLTGVQLSSLCHNNQGRQMTVTCKVFNNESRLVAKAEFDGVNHFEATDVLRFTNAVPLVMRAFYVIQVCYEIDKGKVHTEKFNHKTYFKSWAAVGSSNAVGILFATSYHFDILSLCVSKRRELV